MIYLAPIYLKTSRMKPLIRFNRSYSLIFVLVLLIEVAIAFFGKGFIRYFVGDLLIVILIYSFLMSFLRHSKLKIGILVLIFAFLVEFSQFFTSNLANSDIMTLIIGHRFDGWDLLAYTIGMGMVFGIEILIDIKKSK